MQIKSLGYRTDLIFPAFDGEIRDRGDYLVVRSPSNPTFYWGNFLLFEHPPGEGDYVKWRELFCAEIGKPPEFGHQAFGWDTTAREVGRLQPFLDDGFHLDHGTVLTAQRNDLIPKSSPHFDLRPLDTDDEWNQGVENQVVSRGPLFSEGGYRPFRQRQMQRYREMVAQGIGIWFGAFSEQRLVADLGIFCDRVLGRYQSVQTHPDFRRRGIAGNLVYQAGVYAFENHDIDTLVIIAKADSPAQRLYQSIGFQFTEYQMGIWKADIGTE